MSQNVASDRRQAYMERMRALGRPQRAGGFIACLVGVLMMTLARYRLDSSLLLWSGGGVVALGWALFIYALARRLLWVRAHPFDPNG